MAILALMLGFGLLSQWKRTPVTVFNQQVRKLAVISVVTATVLTLVTGYEWDWFTWLAVLLGVWIFVVSAADLFKRASARQGSLASRLSLGRSYYAMMFGHIGFALMVIGAVVVSMHSVERDVRIVAGQIVPLGDYQLMFDSEEKVRGPNYTATRVNVRVLRNNDLVSVLTPEKRVYFSQSSPMTEAGIDAGFWRDIYVALGEELGDGAWAVRVQYKPLVRWIWLGAIFMFIAGGLAVFDKRYRFKKTQPESTKLNKDLKVA
jgi:cytochrome c-type biogenesis protein CcmF